MVARLALRGTSGRSATRPTNSGHNQLRLFLDLGRGSERIDRINRIQFLKILFILALAGSHLG